MGAQTLDHADRTMAAWGTRPGDMLPPTNRLSNTATAVGTVKSWLGPVADEMAPDLPASWTKVASRTGIGVEDVARERFPQLFNEIDKVNKAIDKANEEFRVANALAKDRRSRTGKTEATDALIDRLMDTLPGKRTAEGRAKTLQDIQDIRDMQAMGRRKQVLPSRYDPAQRLMTISKLSKREKELKPLVKDAIAQSQGQWEYTLAQAQALSEQFKGKYLTYKWPKEEGPVVTLVEGPSHPKELRAHEIDVPQLRDP